MSDLLAPHLAEDAVDVLRPAAHVRGEADRLELLAEQRHDFADVALAIEPALVDEPRDPLVLVRLQRAQRQILELPLELPQSEAIRERRVDVHDFACGFAAFRLVCVHQEAQRLRALGELDQHDADVLDHRKQHLAKILGLRGALRAVAARRQRLHRVHARDAIDERGDVGAELAPRSRCSS